MEQSKLEKIKEAAYMAMVDFAKSDRDVPNASEIAAVLKRMDATGCKGLAKNMKLELWVIVRDCITFTNREQLDKIEKALLGIIARYGREKEARRKSFSLTKWLSFDDELPEEENQSVLILSNGIMKIATFDKQTREFCVKATPSGERIFRPNDIDFWMPIPSLPETILMMR